MLSNCQQNLSDLVASATEVYSCSVLEMQHLKQYVRNNVKLWAEKNSPVLLVDVGGTWFVDARLESLWSHGLFFSMLLSDFLTRMWLLDHTPLDLK